MADTVRRASEMRAGGYQGSSDPGEPTDLMQPQTRPATCRHEWVLGSDGCVNCGESWLALHPEEVLAPMERRGLNRLLAVFPKATIHHAGRPPSMMNRLGGGDMETPWVWCDLIPEFGARVRSFAIWKTTGDVYELDSDGAVGDEPVIKLYRISQETTPRVEHRTSFETVAPSYVNHPRYVPTCSCGFRGAAVSGPIAALAAANAHARAQEAEPQPPGDCHS